MPGKLQHHIQFSGFPRQIRAMSEQDDRFIVSDLAQSLPEIHHRQTEAFTGIISDTDQCQTAGKFHRSIYQHVDIALIFQKVDPGHETGIVFVISRHAVNSVPGAQIPQRQHQFAHPVNIAIHQITAEQNQIGIQRIDFGNDQRQPFRVA